MRALGRLQYSIALCLLTACATTSVAQELPAVIVRPDAHSRAELQRAVSHALDRTFVPLADDALTRRSRLTIEPVRLRDPQGGIAQGRETRMPEQFRLVKSGHQCVLIRERTGQRIPLLDTKCAARH
jgi:hypothetical protein